MALKPEISIPAAAAVSVAVYGIFQLNMPNLTEVRANESDDTHIESAERAATWESAGFVGALSLIAKDPVIFWFGGAMTILLAWKYRHANMVSPLTGKATSSPTSRDVAAAQMPAGNTTGTADTAPAAPAYSPVI